MDDIGTDLGGEGRRNPSRRGSRRAAPRRTRRARGCLPILLILVLLVAGLWFGGELGGRPDQDRLGGNPDYAGPGSGSVTIEVGKGDTAAQIGRNLKAAEVVKSVGAFTDAANADPHSRDIQVGYYELKKQMKAADALAVLVDPANLIQAKVTIPEGFRVKDIVRPASPSRPTSPRPSCARRCGSRRRSACPRRPAVTWRGTCSRRRTRWCPGESAAQLLTTDDRQDRAGREGPRRRGQGPALGLHPARRS